MAEYADRERFIPIEKVDLVDRLANSDIGQPHDRERFLLFSKILDSLFPYHFVVPLWKRHPGGWVPKGALPRQYDEVGPSIL